MPKGVPVEIRDQRIDDYGVSARTLNCLRSHRPPIVTIGQLAVLSNAELPRVPTLGRKTFDKIRQLLRALGVQRA